MKPLFSGLLAAALALSGTSEARPLRGAAAARVDAAPDYARAIASPARTPENRALDEGRKPMDVLSFAGFRPGEVVADFGAGGGYYSELISSAVGANGRVLALATPVKYYNAAAWDKVRAAHANIGLIVSDNADLAPRSVDAIFSHLVFHDLFLPGRDAGAVLANWHAAVKPGGRVIIVDHRGAAGDTSAIASTLHRIDPAVAIAAMVAAGFVPDGQSDVLHRSDDSGALIVFDPQIRGKTDRFVLRFRRP